MIHNPSRNYCILCNILQLFVKIMLVGHCYKTQGRIRREEATLKSRKIKKGKQKAGYSPNTAQSPGSCKNTL